MVTIQEAVQASKRWMLSIYEASEVPELLLEEISRTEDGRYWLVTMGFRAPSGHVTIGGRGALTALQPPRVERVPRAYKRLKVHADTGDVESMEIRDP